MTRHTSQPTDSNRYSRRHVLAAGTLAAAALAGCAETDETADGEASSQQERPAEFVADPPDAVYKPTHREGMVMDPMIEAGDYTLLPHFTYEHTFWLMSGGAEPVEEDPEAPGVHLMFAAIDSETGEQIPLDIISDIIVRQDGEQIDRRDPWPMIAQSMGMHFGDNIPLEFGTYEVEVQLSPINARKTGAFEDRFEESVTATYTLEYDEEIRSQLIDDIEWLPEDEWGEPGALELMDHDGHGDHDHGHDDDGHDDDHADGGHGDDHGHDDAEADDDAGSYSITQLSSHDHDDNGHDDHGHDDDHAHGDHGHPEMDLPPAEEYPGTDLGVYSSGDADFVVRHIEDSRLAEDGDDYLLVSPRTPYNRIPLPDMSLEVEGDLDEELVQTIDDELGHHYGLTTDLEGVESFDIVVDSPPQIARHQGYETAFIEMSAMTVEVE